MKGNFIFLKKAMGEITPGGEAGRRIGYKQQGSKYIDRVPDKMRPGQYIYSYETTGSKKTPPEEATKTLFGQVVQLIQQVPEISRINEILDESIVLNISNMIVSRGGQISPEVIVQEIINMKNMLGYEGDFNLYRKVWVQGFTKIFSMVTNRPSEYIKKFQIFSQNMQEKIQAIQGKFVNPERMMEGQNNAQ